MYIQVCPVFVLNHLKKPFTIDIITTLKNNSTHKNWHKYCKAALIKYGVIPLMEISAVSGL